MIRYFCDSCTKEVGNNYIINATTYETVCGECLPKEEKGKSVEIQKDNEPQKYKDNQGYVYDGRWSRHARAEKEHYGSDILQPFNKKGYINEKFIDVYGAGYYSEVGRGDITRHYLHEGSPRQRRATIAGLATDKIQPSQHLGFDMP